MSTPFTVVAILAAYNEDDVIAQVVRSLIDNGVQVYFLDHHSTDRTAAEVGAFRGRGVIGIEKFPADGVDDDASQHFAWRRILQRKEQLARELDADWFIHHDADEFRESAWVGTTLREGIERVDALGYNAIDFRVLNFSPTTADPTGVDDIRSRLLFYEPGQTFDSQQVKCWKKTRQPVVLAETGGHSAQFADRRIFPVRFLLRHYPIRSQAHGERKVFQERLPRFHAPERARGWHVQYDHAVEGMSFVRDPAALVRYDPEAARLDLWLRHRDVERLERLTQVSQDEADRLVDENVTLREHVQTLGADLDGLRVEHQGLLASRSWKLTAPLRAADRLLRGQSPGHPGARVDGMALPVSGAISLSGRVSGSFGDGWIGAELRFRMDVIQPITAVQVSGSIPLELVEGQQLRLRIGDREWTHQAGPGPFKWSVPIALAPEPGVEFVILASRSWRPSSVGPSNDARDLAWRLSGIHAH